jgi:ABC-type multidrug transport system permease subunit
VVATDLASRPSNLSLVAGQFQYSNRSYWRTPVAAFFTLIFPTSFLVVICAIAGNAVMDERSGVRLAQFLTPVFAVFGVCMASFVSLALGVAYARHAGVLKRLRTTPLPAWAHIAGRLLTAVFVSLIAVALVTGIGIVFYDVDIIWRTLPAVLLTLIVGIACFAALGLAVVSIAPTPGATQALANGGLILLAFISDVFIVTLPDWLDRVGWIFPLKHFVNAVADGFNPFLTGSGLYWDHLAVMAAWGVAGTAVAIRFFRWEPPPAHVSRRDRRAIEVDEAVPAGARRRELSEARTVGSPSISALVLGQTRYATIKLLRDPMAVFFAIVFPVLLLVFFSAIYGREAQWGGLPLPQYLAAAFSVYGVCVMAYVNFAGGVAEDRSRGVLKRLRGSPLPSGAYLAGRIGAAIVLGAMTVALVFGLGAILFGVRVSAWGLLVTAAVFVLIIGCAATLGLLLVSLVQSEQTVIAVALGTLLPLSMISDIFINAPDLPDTLSTIGWVFPLRHMSYVAVQASSGQPLGGEWLLHLAVIMAWAFVAGVLAARFFRWEASH